MYILVQNQLLGNDMWNKRVLSLEWRSGGVERDW